MMPPFFKFWMFLERTGKSIHFSYITGNAGCYVYKAASQQEKTDCCSCISQGFAVFKSSTCCIAMKKYLPLLR